MHKIYLVSVAIFASACAVDSAADGEDNTGAAEQLITGWAAGAWGTTTDLVGLDTGWSGSSTCVLSGVLGNLTGGAQSGAGAVLSEAGIEIGPTFDNYIVGHGGASSIGGQRVWAFNPVMAGGVCIPLPTTAFNVWHSAPAQFGVAPPVKIANLFTNRRCYLSSVISGGGIFGKWADSVSVVQIGVGQTNASHPTPGWYIQGTLASSSDPAVQATATAACVDFPSISAEWGGAFGGATNTMTTGGGVKMCGLTGIFGAFNVNSYADGVSLNAPSTQNGNWTMTVSANKFATANCVQ